MQCITCGSSLDTSTSEFIICPNCNTVNIANSADRSSQTLVNNEVAVATISNPSDNLDSLSVSNNHWKKLKHPTKNLILVLSSISTLVILILILSIYLIMQNARASSLLSKAQLDIAKGQYTVASSLLNTAANIYSWPSTHKKILEVKIQDEAWAIDANDLKQATALVEEHNFTQATLLMNNIHTDFPGYSSVIALQKTIASDKQVTTVVAKSPATQVAVVQTPTVKATTVPSTHKSSTSSSDIPSSDYGSYSEPVYTNYGYNFYYAGASDTITANGVSVDFTQEQPQVTQTSGSYNHSLMELAILGNDGDTVEVGWIVDQPQFGDSLPHLFVYHFAQGATTCYDGCGFVQVSNTNIAGETVTPGATASFESVYSNGQWDIYYNGNEVGYFPESVFGNSFTQTDEVKIFGEVATTSSMCIQMGNGIPGSSSGSAEFSNLSFIGASTPSHLQAYDTISSPYSYGDVSSTGLSIGGPGSC